MVTIKEVAAYAGTSFKTVSRVVNNDPKVREETRARVQRAIDELGYRPNSAARMMRSQKSGVIGLLADQVTTTPSAVDIVRRVQELAWQQNKMLMVINVEKDPDQRRRAMDLLMERRPEGLIYAAMYHQPTVPLDYFYKIPTVLVNCYCEDGSLPSVVPDEYGAAREATLRLIAAGHQRIGFLSLNPFITAAPLRRKGFLDAMADKGLSVDDGYVRNAIEPALADTSLEGDEVWQVRREVHALMALPEPPTAIFCTMDKIALEAYFALIELGIKPGQDVAIIGFDNEQSVAPHLKPGLSTMQLPHAEMGEWAMNYLLSGNSNKIQATLPCPFVGRGSF